MRCIVCGQRRSLIAGRGPHYTLETLVWQRTRLGLLRSYLGCLSKGQYLHFDVHSRAMYDEIQAYIEQFHPAAHNDPGPSFTRWKHFVGSGEYEELAIDVHQMDSLLLNEIADALEYNPSMRHIFLAQMQEAGGIGMLGEV